MKFFSSVATIVLFSLTTPIHAAESLQDRLATAKPGDTVQLPAGEFNGGATLPAGVSIKGAGFGKTIIDAKGSQFGILVSDGQNVSISDLTVRNAADTNLLVKGGRNVTLQRVRATGSLIGASLNNSNSSRIENTLCDGNRYGIVVAGGEGNVVVNCTMAGNASTGLSLSSGKDIVAFNNCSTDSATAVYVGEQTPGLVLDHNLYLGINIGKFKSALARNTLNNWKYLTGQESHSVDMPVKYDNPAEGRYAVTNVLNWSPDRTITAGWGAPSLVGKDAPTVDIDGNKRPNPPGLGAFETQASAPGPANGTFTVTTGNGLTSAGVFNPQGKLLAYLFQNLPLKKGAYSFWLPSRTYKGANIEPGDYEVRLTESKLDWENVGWIGNSSVSDNVEDSCPADPDAVVFDGAGRMISGRGPSEAGDNIRAFDATTGKPLWVFNGSWIMRGLAIAGDGNLYTLRWGGDARRVSRIDPATGKTVPWVPTDFGHFSLKDAKTFNGLTALDDQLWYTDTTNNQVWIGTTQSPQPTKNVEVKSPQSLAADAKTKIVWVISEGEKLLALSPEGKIVAEAKPVPEPVALAARDGRLAVASKQTGKVYLFDSSDPASLKELSTIGRGDGPDGRVLPDRFLFQEGASQVYLALGPNQELAVGEHEGRLQVFDPQGKQLWGAVCTGGFGITASKLTPGRAFAGGFTMRMDTEQKKWWPESYHRALHTVVVGEFEIDGQLFLAANDPPSGISFVKFTVDKATPTYGFISKWGTNDPWTIREDSNHDHLITIKDDIVSTLTDAQGKPVIGPRILNEKFVSIWPNGELTSLTHENWLTHWPCAGLDQRGYPIYRFEDRESLRPPTGDFISPYDSSPTMGSTQEHAPRPHGGWMCIPWLAGGPAARHKFLPGGSDLAGVDKDGRLDWLHTFGQYPDNPRIGSLDMVDGVYIAALSNNFDFFVIDSDGLSMQGFSFPLESRYVGHWVDHPDSVTTFTDKQGRLNVLMSDYTTSRNPWFVLRNKEIHNSKTNFQIKPETAALLTAQPATKLEVAAGKVPSPTVHIAKLKAPLTIDGDLQKWRDTGITPQVICTPESSAGIDGGPGDCSALVRLAYHGQDLYLQILRFDDIVSFHQNHFQAYQQDTVEVCINGTLEGIKFNLSETTDLGPVNQIDGWGLPAHALDKNDSPLVIKVLDNAEAVTERQTIENIYGVDMRNAKVQIIETKVPMDAKTYAKREEAIFELKTGAEFWLGLLIDDNDNPGTDVQNMINWPPTYGTASAKDGGARAILD